MLCDLVFEIREPVDENQEGPVEEDQEGPAKKRSKWDQDEEDDEVIVLEPEIQVIVEYVCLN